MRNLCWSERLTYVLTQAAGIFRADAQSLPANVAPQQKAKQIFEIGKTVAMRWHISRIRKNYRRTVRLHRPQLYEGEIEIFATEKLFRRDPTLGWSQLVPNGLHMHPLPGNHWTSLRDHTEAAAAELRKCLELTDAESQVKNQNVPEP